MGWLIVGAVVAVFLGIFAKLISKLTLVHLEFGGKNDRDDFEIRMPREIKPPDSKTKKQLRK